MRLIAVDYKNNKWIGIFSGKKSSYHRIISRNAVVLFYIRKQGGRYGK